MNTKVSRNEKRLPHIHPGEILNEEFLLPLNITQYRLAKEIGVDARRIHSIVRGERSITAETALLLSRFSATQLNFGWDCKVNLMLRSQRTASLKDLAW